MTEKRPIIRQETEADYSTVENLTREAFWNVYRPGCTEHYVLHRYRDDPAFVPQLDLVMELDGEPIGQIIYVRSHIDADDRQHPVLRQVRLRSGQSQRHPLCRRPDGGLFPHPGADPRLSRRHLRHISRPGRLFRLRERPGGLCPVRGHIS